MLEISPRCLNVIFKYLEVSCMCIYYMIGDKRSKDWGALVYKPSVVLLPTSCLIPPETWHMSYIVNSGLHCCRSGKNTDVYINSHNNKFPGKIFLCPCKGSWRGLFLDKSVTTWSRSLGWLPSGLEVLLSARNSVLGVTVSAAFP